MISPEVMFEFSIIRLAPDPVREEFANVGVVAVSEFGVEIRVLETAPPHLKAIAPPTAIDAIPEIRLSLQRALHLPGNRGRLDDVVREGMSGFSLTAPKRRIFDQTEQTLAQAVDALFREYVAPRRWRTATHVRRPTPLEKVIRDVTLARVSKAEVRLALGLTFRTQHLLHTFPLAYANGRATIVQAVDLSLTDKSQEIHTEEAIARIAEVNAAIGERVTVWSTAPTWVCVTRPGAGAERFQARLGKFSEVITDDGLDELAAAVDREAVNPVEQAFQALGLQATRKELAVEVNAG